MARWLVQLQAHAEDLEEFTAWFPSGEVFAFAERDSVFLTGAGLDAHADAGATMAAAEQALDERFAVISLLSRSAKRPVLGGIFREDDAGNRQEHHLLAVEFSVSLRGRVRGGSGPTQAQLLLSGSQKSSSLRNALLLWADSYRTWPRLYRILEELESHLGMHANKAGLCTATERTRFTQSANVAEVAGKDSRHAAGKYAVPASPMSVRDATSFVSRLLQAALRRAAGF